MAQTQIVSTEVEKARASYKRVLVEGRSPNGDPIHAVVQVRGRSLRTYRYRSDFLATRAQCEAYARELLAHLNAGTGAVR